jgi:hypothetical protein
MPFLGRWDGQNHACPAYVGKKKDALTQAVKSVLLEKGDGEVFAAFSGQFLKTSGCKAGTDGGRLAGVPSLVFSLLIVLFLVSLVLSIR